MKAAQVWFRNARWIWSAEAPSPLPGTFVLFRKEFSIGKKPMSCAGRIFADTRYRLFVNGRRVQSGPAPCDPRWPELDPFDITEFLHEGKNVVAVEVAFLGNSENDPDNPALNSLIMPLGCPAI